jgi:hypothetical protein
MLCVYRECYISPKVYFQPFFTFSDEIMSNFTPVSTGKFSTILIFNGSTLGGLWADWDLGWCV